ncbi:hypothetical protein HQQ94_15940 [Shewanella sp. VB17]|uniref:hypothetical protein n=1 Tax=Shewanella sp. VB17 TaxID=2739432 RepID=UPI001563B368|nr:hypothetical protein [Shewanella sp. VB17]NRD74685.1 hypothetical protein [Shewanella sp. VB17]
MTMVFTSPLSHFLGQQRNTQAVNDKLKWLGLGLLLLLTLLMIDYSINQSDGQWVESTLLPELPSITYLTDPLNDATEVLALYHRFDQSEVAEVDEASLLTEDLVDSMPLAEQNKQSGLLSKLYIGNRIYRLSGIVRADNVQSGEYKAALSVSYSQALPQKEQTASEVEVAGVSLTNTGSSALSDNTYMSLIKGDELSPYQVELVDNRRLVLTDNHRRLWLELFVPTNYRLDDTPEHIESH